MKRPAPTPLSRSERATLAFMLSQTEQQLGYHIGGPHEEYFREQLSDARALAKKLRASNLTPKP